jgi:uncharacterized SAM-binding protein YcdF (DUF218 family)
VRYLKLTPPTRRHYVVSALVLAAIVVAGFAFRGLGQWLVVRSELPERLDVIFTFGGETARDTYALRLSEQHPEATLVISAHSAARTRLLLGGYLDDSRTVIVDSLANTWEEVKFLRGWLAGYRAQRAKARLAAQESDSLEAILAGLGAGSEDGGEGTRTDARSPDSAIRNHQSAISVALVSGPYHMRRIKVAAVRMLRDRDVRLYYAPAPLELYRQSEEQYRHWWRDPGMRSLVRAEAGKTLYYLVRL